MEAQRKTEAKIPYLEGHICQAEFSELGSGVAGILSQSGSVQQRLGSGRPGRVGERRRTRVSYTGRLYICHSPEAGGKGEKGNTSQQ